ncbi:MAG: methionine gamma-lyase family protein [Saccharofermentanales bacterium]
MNDSSSDMIKRLYRSKGISDKVISVADDVEKCVGDVFKDIEKIREYNQIRVLSALQEVRLSDSHFGGSTGYGYDDAGRERIEQAYAMIFGGEAAYVRSQIASGTQAITMALFGVLRPGDILLSVTGRPYDTLSQVIGLSGATGMGSLTEFGITYEQIDFTPAGEIDYEAISKSLKKKVKAVFIQKSKGYTNRRALLSKDIGEIVKAVRSAGSDAIIITDNCYGEFVESQEPCQAGADLCAGSLIKNPGGGICPTGGYLVGRKDLIEKAASRFTAPGIGSHIGPTMGINRTIAQGLFLAPHVVAEALKGAVFASELFCRTGFDSNPGTFDLRGDIVQTLIFNDPDPLIKFCQTIQASSPVDSFVSPQPWDMPGYDCPVIMAAGTFIQGASIELSCDAPLKPPYIAYMQGGLVYEHVKFASMAAVSGMGKDT